VRCLDVTANQATGERELGVEVEGWLEPQRQEAPFEGGTKAASRVSGARTVAQDLVSS
jgi:hypothetical protein